MANRRACLSARHAATTYHPRAMALARAVAPAPSASRRRPTAPGRHRPMSPGSRLTSQAAGSGNGSVGFAVAPSRDDVRRGSIVVASQRIVVTQASGVPSPPPPPPPSPRPRLPHRRRPAYTPYRATPTSSGPTTAPASSACPRRAPADGPRPVVPPWLFVSAGSSGAGNGFVEYRYLTNPGAQRTGTLTIGGLTFTVTQPAAP